MKKSRFTESQIVAAINKQDALLTEEKLHTYLLVKDAGVSRSSLRHKAKLKDDSLEEGLLDALTTKHPTIGFRSCHYRIRNRGEHLINYKRLRRVYPKMKLSIRRRAKRRLPVRIKKPTDYSNCSQSVLEPGLHERCFE